MKKSVNKKFNLSNKLSYTIIVVLAILLIGVSVYAYGTSSPSTFGHSISEIDPPAYCGGTGYNDGYLIYQGGWDCTSISYPSPSSSVTVVSEEFSGYTSGYASCPAGTVLIGGGCNCQNEQIQISNQREGHPNDWYCLCSASETIEVTAFCLD